MSATPATPANPASPPGADTTTPPQAPRTFDLYGPLPTGTTLLEASAGTGKTYAIATLATRYVAEGEVSLSELLLVTFGRAATSELRERVRARLASTYRALAGPDARHSDDELVAFLANTTPDDAARRRERLGIALGQFDAATISTTHGFCQQMLDRLGVLADRDPQAVMVGDLAELGREVVRDVYLAKYSTSGRPPFSLDEALRLGRAALGDPFAELEPAAPQPETPAWHRMDFAHAVVNEVDRRKRRQHLLDYDDLMSLLYNAMTHPQLGGAAVERLREQYRVVLVDEFQDTDQVQWDILHRAFHAHATLILVGDPKQAIYAFRGGDVFTYLQARDVVQAQGREATLDLNHRSTPAVLAGLNHVFRSAALGDERIVVRRMLAAGGAVASEGGETVAAVRIRQLTREALSGPKRHDPSVDEARRGIVRDVTAQAIEEIRAGREPGEIAVLARRNKDAIAVQQSLVQAGVPAVISGATSVFTTRAAQEWLRLLDALADPSHAARSATLALTPFIGWSAEQLSTAPDVEREHLARRVRQWARVCADAGVGVLVEDLMASGLAERLTAAGGDRLLTDVRHLGELMRDASRASTLDAAGLAEWLRNQIRDVPTDYAENLSRRLETDAAAVQVMTVHASKGLEFPVVFVPFAWDRWEAEHPEKLLFHDRGGRRILHLGGPTDQSYEANARRHWDEERGEDLRLLYVALTRAADKVVLWWAPTQHNSAGGAVSRVLLGQYEPGAIPPATVSVAHEGKVSATLTELVASSNGALGLDIVTELAPVARYEPAPRAPQQLAAATWRRQLDLTFRRLSYTALTSAAHHDAPVAVVDEPEPDQDDEAFSAGIDPVAAQQEPLPLSELPAGAAFGTVVHEALERFDPAQVSPLRSAAAVLRELAVEHSGAQLDADQLTALGEGLAQAVETPLGGLADARALIDFSVRDRLSELDFELPLGGGDDLGDRRPVRLGDIAALLREHLRSDDALAGYPERLEQLIAHDPDADAVLRGYLTGSIDAVLRVAVHGDFGAASARYLVVDYKTNRLAPSSEPLTPWHYRPARVREEMFAAHYPLQMLLYLVALHRFLRWRVRDYDPDQHLGGGLYLFLRGMTPTSVTSYESGAVFAWTPPSGLVPALSALLDGLPSSPPPPRSPAPAAPATTVRPRKASAKKAVTKKTVAKKTVTNRAAKTVAAEPMLTDGDGSEGGVQ